MNLTPEQKLRRNIKFALDRTPSASGPESIAVLIEVSACVLNVMRKALVALGAPASVLDAHDDGDGDVVEQWIEAQPRRVPITEGQQDTSKQDAEDYRKEQEALSEARNFLHRLKAERGAIVSSGDCSAIEIAEAQACRRFYVDEDGYGYVLRARVISAAAGAAGNRTETPS